MLKTIVSWTIAIKINILFVNRNFRLLCVSVQAIPDDPHTLCRKWHHHKLLIKEHNKNVGVVYVSELSTSRSMRNASMA